MLNVIAGERYKMFSKESKGLLHGEYGRLPGEVNEEVRRKAIGDESVITCRPADLLEPELENYRNELGDLAEQEEDVLSYALFPKVALDFFARRKADREAEEVGRQQTAQSNRLERNADKADSVRTIYVEDLTEGMPL